MKYYKDYWPGFSFYFTVGRPIPKGKRRENLWRLDRDGLRIAIGPFALAIYRFDLERKLGFLMKHYLNDPQNSL